MKTEENHTPKMVVLVVEDDPGLNSLICKKLDKSGYHTLSARSGADALELIGEEEIDLILLDYQLPDMQGKVVIEAAAKKKLEVPFITITGHGDERIAVEMMKAGAMDYLVKDAEFLYILPEKVHKARRELSVKRELKQSRVALKESELRSKRILDSMKDPVMICSSNHTIEYTNPAMQELSRTDILGEPCHKAVLSSSRRCDQCPSLDTLSKQDIVRSVRIGKDRNERMYQVSIAPINFLNGGLSRLHIFRDVTEIIRTKELAEKNERKYRMLADNAVDLVWQMDLRLKFTYMSPSATSILGYDLDEMVGHHLWEFARRKDFIHMARKALEAIRDYKNFTTTTFESVILRKNGREIPVEITGKLLRTKEGKLTGLQGATRDISQRVAAQKEQRRQHTLLRTLIDNMPDQIYIKDGASRYLMNNTGHQVELEADSQEELLGKSDFDYFDEVTAEEFYRDEQRIISTGIPLINKEEFKTLPDGSSKWTLTTKVPIRDQKGNVTGIAGINRDITQRKAIEEELLRSRYEVSLRNRIAGIFLTADTEEIFDRVLKLFIDEFRSHTGFFGYLNERNELVCLSRLPVFPDREQQPANTMTPNKDPGDEPFASALHERRSVIFNKELTLPDGQLTLQNALCTPILIQGEPLGLICVGNSKSGYRDPERQLMETIASYIAPILQAHLNEQRMKQAKEQAFRDLKIAKEKAEESDKLKTAFLLNLSHELRTPLNAIMGFSRIIADQSRDQGTTSYYSEQIDIAGEDLMKMVEDTIEMARLQNRQVKLDAMKREVSRTLEEIGSEYRKHYSKSFPGISFSVKDMTGGIELNTDHGKIVKAVMKLLDNAVKFTGKGKVELGGRTNGKDTLMIWVKDTGIGIPCELHEAVFEKFRKVEDRKTLYRGNGLGLPIAKGLIERIGGTIRLESQPEKGTVVTISLPVANQEQTISIETS